MLRGRVDGGSRKPRLFVDSSDSKADEESKDPIAAALAARKRKQEQALKAAAAAAAKAAAANLTTYFADDPPPKQKQQQDTGLTLPAIGNKKPQALSDGLSQKEPPAAEKSLSPAEPASPPSAQTEQQDGGNPLASLLGYSGDDGSGSEAGDATPDRELPDEQPEPKPASEDKDNDIDAELANFMEELESSGLLKEDNAPEEDVKGDTQPSADAASSQSAAAAASTAVDEHQVPPAGEDVASAQPDKDAGQAAEAILSIDPAESAEAAQGGEAAEDGEAAEQQVLGSLTGCPGWHEVMDMASGKVYFWNEENNEVAWDPPEGSQPRTEGENEAVFAAAYATPETIEAVKIKSPAAAAEDVDVSAEDKQAAPLKAQVPSEMKALGLSTAEAPDDVQMAEREDGELEAGPANVPMPDEAVEKAAQDLLAQSWAAAEQLCGQAPLLVWLAIEAEVRLRDWQALAAMQRQAAETSNTAGSLSWESYQSAAKANLELLQGVLPGALQEAEAAAATAVAVVKAAAKQAEEAAVEDGEVSPDTDGAAHPPLPEEPQAVPAESPAPLPAEDASVDMDTTDDAAHTQTPAPASTPPTSVAQAATTPVEVSAPLPSTSQPLSALPQPQPISAADPLVAQINTRIAAATAGQPAGAAASSAPKSLPRPAMPVLTPLPTLAPQWPGYYQPHVPYAYPHMPYPYMSYPMLYVSPQIPHTASAPMPAATPQHPTAVGEAASVAEDPPPLPREAQPPLPSSSSGPEQPPAETSATPATTAAVKQHEYRAEPVRVATPPMPAEPPDEAPPASAPIAAAPEEESKKRKAKKSAAASVKRRAFVKVGSLAPSVLNKWAAARKDLEEKEEGDEGMDVEAVERKRMREAEEWREKQLRSGVSSQDNSNFQPLAMDWREKIKANKSKAAEAPKAAAVKAEPLKFASKPDLEALSVGLPPGWKALWDKKSGEIYYGNPSTKETSWEKPE